MDHVQHALKLMAHGKKRCSLNGHVQEISLSPLVAIGVLADPRIANHFGPNARSSPTYSPSRRCRLDLDQEPAGPPGVGCPLEIQGQTLGVLMTKETNLAAASGATREVAGTMSVPAPLPH
jgi:hypothetical protein